MKIDAMIASYAAHEAPVALEVLFSDVRPWRGGDPVYDKIYRFLPAQAETNRAVKIRSLGGRLWAPFSPVSGDDPFTMRSGRGRQYDLGSLLEWSVTSGLTRLNPFLELPQQPPGAQGQQSTVDIRGFLTGSTVVERSLRRANQDVALIDDIVHVVVYEPAWRFDTIQDGPAGRRPVARLCIPIDEGFEARLRVRQDHMNEAASLFPKLLRPSRRQVPQQIEFCGEVRVVSSDFRYQRNDQRLVALDAARNMAAATSVSAAKLTDDALLARSALIALRNDPSAATAELFRACDQFAAELGQTSEAGAALRVHQQLQLRRQTWAELEREARAT
ncbi:MULTISPECIES: hypothetical protein [unclassified Bradyrhizobium]